MINIIVNTYLVKNLLFSRLQHKLDQIINYQRNSILILFKLSKLIDNLSKKLIKF